LVTGGWVWGRTGGGVRRRVRKGKNAVIDSPKKTDLGDSLHGGKAKRGEKA